MAGGIFLEVDATQIARLARLAEGGALITHYLGDALDQLKTEIVQAVHDHMHFTRGYETGELRESIRGERTGLTLAVGTDVGHAAFVEYGTGQRGAASGVVPGAGYAYGARPGMTAEPYMAPALEEMTPVIELYLGEAVEGGLDEMAHG